MSVARPQPVVNIGGLDRAHHQNAPDLLEDWDRVTKVGQPERHERPSGCLHLFCTTMHLDTYLGEAEPRMAARPTSSVLVAARSAHLKEGGVAWNHLRSPPP